MNKIKINKKRLTYNIVGLVVLVLLIGGALLLFSSHPTASIITPEDEAAKVGIKTEKPVVVSPQPKNTLAIIFYYEGYDSQTDALHYIDVFKTALSETEPFKSMGGYLFFNTFTSGSGACHIEDRVNKWLVCSPELLKSLEQKGYKNFKLIVLSPEKFVSASSLSPTKNSLVTISTFQGDLTDPKQYQWMSILFTQELGHALGLQYEYENKNPSDFKDALSAQEKLFPSQSILKESPNCVQEKTQAEKNWGVGMYPMGCGDSDTSLYPESQTLMSDLPVKGVYGAVSETYLRNLILCRYGAVNSPECTAFTNKYL